MFIHVSKDIIAMTTDSIPDRTIFRQVTSGLYAMIHMLLPNSVGTERSERINDLEEPREWVEF